MQVAPVFDRVHPSHTGPNTVDMTRELVAQFIVRAGHRQVLDLPAGSGALTQRLLDAHIEVTPADLDPSAFVVPGKVCVRADMHQPLPFPDGTFDGVACIEGIEHIENPHLLAREANRVLKVGGRVYISTPNVLSMSSRLSYLLRGYPDQFQYMIDPDPQSGRDRSLAHINPIGFLELRYVLAIAGFRVDLVETNRLMSKGSVLSRVLRLLMLTRGKRAAASHPQVHAVREWLLSDTVLFGETLIIGAVKET